MQDGVFVFYLMYIGMTIYSALALALFITYLILNKNNNFGDFSPKMDEYSATGIRYRREVDNVSSQENKFLFLEYGENPYANRKHSYPEQLLKFSQKEQNDI